MLKSEHLTKYPHFRVLSNACLREAVKRSHKVNLPAGTEIIRQNTPADHFYFIRRGEVEISERTRHGQNACINHLVAGESFGEMALPTSTHTATAKTDVTLYRFDRNDFEAVTRMDSSLKTTIDERLRRYTRYNQLKTLQPFALLPPEKMLNLVGRMHARHFHSCETVLREGDPEDRYYIIKEGEASVRRGNQFIGALSAGDGFGEEAIIRGHLSRITITAITDLVVLSLSKEDFNSLLKQSFLNFAFSGDVLQEEASRYTIIDARVPAEYEEEHIAGAVNIPLENLRRRFSELDPDRNYLTYCLNDSRGMVAAFLMSSQGFHARCLRGGLSGWEGPLAGRQGRIYYPED